MNDMNTQQVAFEIAHCEFPQRFGLNPKPLKHASQTSTGPRAVHRLIHSIQTIFSSPTQHSERYLRTLPKFTNKATFNSASMPFCCLVARNMSCPSGCWGVPSQFGLLGFPHTIAALRGNLGPMARLNTCRSLLESFYSGMCAPLRVEQSHARQWNLQNPQWTN